MLGSYTLYGFYVMDPWYTRGTWKGAKGALYGLSPNTWIAISDWNGKYFLPYKEPLFNTIWTGDYMIVARMDTTTKTQAADVPPYGTWADSRMPSDAMPSMATAPVSSDLSTAVMSGLADNRLTSGTELGVSLSGVTIGDSIQVDSLDASTPSYKLVELRSGDSVVAIALVSEKPQGFALSSVRSVLPGTRLPSVAGAQGALVPDLHQARFVWAMSEESESPYFPVLRGYDTSGDTVTVSPDGARGTGLHPVHR
jgi:hypothetical protein